MTALTPDQRIARQEHRALKQREYSSIYYHRVKAQAIEEAHMEVAEEMAALEQEKARMLLHIRNVETERRQLREALTQCQEAHHGL